MISMAVLFAAILLLNIIPAFAPPTWMAMSWIGFNQPDQNPFLLAVIAACAATMGRLILARCSGWLVRGHLMRDADRQNIDVVKAWLEKRKAVTAGVLLLYAFSPFPSNYLFIAYGLTGLRLWLIGVPFFFGRLASYAAWTHFAQVAHSYLDPELDLEGGYLGAYFVVTQLALLCLVFVLMRIDWSAALNEHRLHFRRPRPGENAHT
ncbi:hypothetical protein [Paraburkholderia aromaticivorans]|uniref:Transmembrane protein n=1 Tax=Paraburkholderia aromaticivorans TaxID=2026199 RepID=A0A248VWY9_9BURK|nr:hypothetical protein [Paraburkholderia aromaticivorans]ASW03508.1 hypothetical protein CJU94_35705 [Paraburkholderia aromaticivorans]